MAVSVITIIKQQKHMEKTVEDRIKEVLKPLIEEVRKEVFLPDYQAEQTEEEILGIIISKYVEWNGVAIQEVAMAAFEDSNFSSVEIIGVD